MYIVTCVGSCGKKRHNVFKMTIFPHLELRKHFEFIIFIFFQTQKRCVDEFWGITSQECPLSFLRGHGEDSGLPNKLGSGFSVCNFIWA